MSRPFELFSLLLLRFLLHTSSSRPTRSYMAASCHHTCEEPLPAQGHQAPHAGMLQRDLHRHDHLQGKPSTGNISGRREFSAASRQDTMLVFARHGTRATGSNGLRPTMLDCASRGIGHQPPKTSAEHQPLKVTYHDSDRDRLAISAAARQHLRGRVWWLRL
jgi:hypothetical protein